MKNDKIVERYITPAGSNINMDDSYNVYHWILAGSGSVREGLHHNQFIDAGTLEEVRAKYSEKNYPVMSKLPNDPMSSFAPSWHDPSACGERWDDDY